MARHSFCRNLVALSLASPSSRLSIDGSERRRPLRPLRGLDLARISQRIPLLMDVVSKLILLQRDLQSLPVSNSVYFLFLE